MYALKPKDLIAIIVVLAFVFLIYNGYKGPLDDLIGLIVGFYFGQRKAGVDSGH